MRAGMLDLKHVVEQPIQVREALGQRSSDAAALLDRVIALDADRRRIILSSQAKAAERNAASKAMARLDKSTEEFSRRRDQLRELSAEVKELERELAGFRAELEAVLAQLPNLPDPSVPDGAGEEQNVEVSRWGDCPRFDFEPKPHWDIGTELGVLDFERAAKLSGSRFTVLRGPAARLERALVHFMLELHTREHGYTELSPPFLLNEAALFGTGQLPKFADDLFRATKGAEQQGHELYLTPTAEVELVGFHAGEILESAELPVAVTAHTPCFRAEAGSHGQDVRGMIRQHQFHKVELVRICRPEQSATELELLVGHAEEVLKRLGLHFRRILLCAGDMGFAAAKTYDLEVWLPAQNAFREISSCSSCGDFQARRAKIRYRPRPGEKPRLVHTLNGSGLAVGRTMIAILEQYQQADGSVAVPEVLRPLMGCDAIRPGPGVSKPTP